MILKSEINEFTFFDMGGRVQPPKSYYQISKYININEKLNFNL